MNPAIDISTHELAQMTEKSMGGKVPLEDILAVWHEIGNVIKSQLVNRRAVRLTSFGTFSFSSKGEPIFNIAAEFASQFKLKQRGQIASGNAPTSSLNFSAVKASLGTSRETIEKIYSKLMTCMGRCLFEGRSVLLTVHRVAEIAMQHGEIACDFMPDFYKQFNVQPTQSKGVEQLRQTANKTINLINTTKQFENSVRREREMDQRYDTGLDIGSHEMERPHGKFRPPSAGDRRNPITGDRSRPQSAGRARPMSASSSQYSASTVASPRGGLNRQALQRHNSSNQRSMTPSTADRANKLRDVRSSSRQQDDASNNARRIAAKALDVGDIVNKVRTKIVERGGSNGMRSIAKLLAIMDDNGDKRLSKDELRYGLRDYGIDLNPTELEQVFLYFDRDRNGFVDVTEFLIGIRGEMNERRRKIVRLAFNILDKDRSGEVDVDEILSVYDLNWHPEVRAGKMTVKEAARDFMKQWDKQEADGKITVAEFEDYYKEISASIDDDDYFELMIRNAWRIAGGTGMAANTANQRVLVTNKDGSQSIQTIEQELGMKRGDKEDMRQRLGRQGVQAEGIELYGGFEDMQQGKKGRSMPQGRPSNAVPRSRSAPRGREAWMDGPQMGDQSAMPDFDAGYDDRKRGKASPRPMSKGQGFDPYESLHKCLYNPPVNLENLCIKLQVSSVNTDPRIAQGALIKRMSTLDPTLDRNQLAAIWKAVDPKNVGIVQLSALHSLLSDRYGKDKTAGKNSSVIDRVVKKILERCGETAGIKGLARTLAIMDNSGDKRLSKEELKCGLQDYGIEVNIREIDDLFTYFDRDRNGFIDVTELLVGIRGDLNDRRRKMVQLAFNSLDTDHSGYVSVEEMMERYNFSAHPEVVAGKKTVKEAAREFMKQWDKHNSDGTVSFEEFEDYYKELSASIDGDDYFELMIRNAWRIAGGTGMAANTANQRVLVTNKDGSQSIQTIEQELGMKRGDKEDMRQRLGRQGVQAEGIELYGGFEDMQKAKTSRGPSQRRPDAPSGRRSMSATTPGRMQQQQQPPPGRQFDRNMAAAKLAAAYRGRLGRKEAEYERRKADAEQRNYEEQQQEMARPRPREITRPKGRSSTGF